MSSKALEVATTFEQSFKAFWGVNKRVIFGGKPKNEAIFLRIAQEAEGLGLPVAQYLYAIFSYLKRRGKNPRFLNYYANQYTQNIVIRELRRLKNKTSVFQNQAPPQDAIPQEEIIILDITRSKNLIQQNLQYMTYENAITLLMTSLSPFYLALDKNFQERPKETIPIEILEAVLRAHAVLTSSEHLWERAVKTYNAA